MCRTIFWVFVISVFCFSFVDSMINVPNSIGNGHKQGHKHFSVYYDKKINMEKWILRARKASPKIKSRYGHIIEREAQKKGLDPNDVIAIIIIESLGNESAISRKGACGLMQLMPGTARDMGVKNIWDPSQNIMGGTKYFRKMLDEFGDFDTALVAYNLGPERTKKFLKRGFDPSKFFFVKMIKKVKNDIVREQFFLIKEKAPKGAFCNICQRVLKFFRGCVSVLISVVFLT